MSNYYCKLYTQHHSKYEESIFDRIGGEFGFKISKSQTTNLSQLPSLFCDLTCKNLCTNETTEGLFSLHKNFIMCHESESSTSLIRVLDVSFSRLQATSQFLKYKLTLTKDQISYELLLPDKNTWKAWTAHLERFCILTDFENKYEIVEVAEKGKHSNMYTIKGNEDRSYYSAKAFNKKELLCSKNSITQVSLINQIETMRALNHRKIIQLIEIHETHDFIYLVTEYIHSQTLEKMLKHHKLSETNTKVIMFSLLKTLAYMASKGILHRNIKPSNILLDDGKYVKVSGFSLATYMNSKKINFGSCGTQGYIAPEVLTFDDKKGHQPYDDKCDVFSAGCIFFQLLFGYPLFQGSRSTEIAASNRRIVDLDISELIEKEIRSFRNKQGLNLLLNLLERDPSKRISAKEALHHPYFRLSSDKGLLDDSNDITINSIDEDILLDDEFKKRQTRRISNCQSGEVSSDEDSYERSSSPLVRHRIPSKQTTALDLTPTLPQYRKSKFSNTNESDCQPPSPSGKAKTVIPVKQQEIKIPMMMPAKRSICDLNHAKNTPTDSNGVSFNGSPSTSYDESEIVCNEETKIHIQSRKWTNDFGSNSPIRNDQTKNTNLRWS